jgi:hypothetical protein
MDVISLSKATKAKKAIKKLQDRLGMNGTEQGKDVRDIYANVKTRLEELEKKDPGVTLYNRVSEVEANTAINLNKHNLYVNSILNKNKYKLTDLVFDDFGDDTGIDKSKSIDYEFDAVGRKVKIANGKTQAEIVTTTEVTDKPPSMIIVSQTTNAKTTNLKDVDLTKGTFNNAEFVDDEIKLKIKGQFLSSNIKKDAVPALTSNGQNGVTISSPNTLYNSGTEVWMLFNDNYSQRIGFNGTVGSYVVVEIDFGANKKIATGYSIIASSFGADDHRSPTEWKVEGYDDTNSNWVLLDVQSGQPDWVNEEKRTFIFTNYIQYSKYRFLLKVRDSRNILEIGQLELLENSYMPYYFDQGTYETPVIDMGDNFTSYIDLRKTINVPTGTNVTFYTATSDDGINFSAYQPLNPDGTIASPQGRYIKIKIELKPHKEQVSLQTTVNNYDLNKVIMNNEEYKLKGKMDLLKRILNVDTIDSFDNSKVVQLSDSENSLTLKNVQTILKRIPNIDTVDSNTGYDSTKIKQIERHYILSGTYS